MLYLQGPSCPEIPEISKVSEVVIKFYSFGKNILKVAFDAQ